MRRPIYPWKTIAVGQSFFAPGRTSTSIMNDARRYHRPARFKSKKVMVNGLIGIKVTRIA